MNNIARLCRETKSAQCFADGYIEYLSNLLRRMDTGKVASFIEELEIARASGNTIFVAGNGGSASTASHMANDIGLGVLQKGQTRCPFRIMSLTDNNPILTAIGNDEGYDKVFVCQLRIFYRPGDRLVVISASGNSPNVIAAAEWVKRQGGRVMGFVGFDGGKLKGMCDLLVHIETPQGEYGPVEDIHMILNHLVASYLQHKGDKKETNGTEMQNDVWQ
jgi:D-sedoheptulose 7-phosphate isomerase